MAKLAVMFSAMRAAAPRMGTSWSLAPAMRESEFSGAVVCFYHDIGYRDGGRFHNRCGSNGRRLTGGGGGGADVTASGAGDPSAGLGADSTTGRVGVGTGSAVNDSLNGSRRMDGAIFRVGLRLFINGYGRGILIEFNEKVAPSIFDVRMVKAILLIQFFF